MTIVVVLLLVKWNSRKFNCLTKEFLEHFLIDRARIMFFPNYVFDNISAIIVNKLIIRLKCFLCWSMVHVCKINFFF